MQHLRRREAKKYCMSPLTMETRKSLYYVYMRISWEKKEEKCLGSIYCNDCGNGSTSCAHISNHGLPIFEVCQSSQNMLLMMSFASIGSCLKYSKHDSGKISLKTEHFWCLKLTVKSLLVLLLRQTSMWHLGCTVTNCVLH